MKKGILEIERKKFSLSSQKLGFYSNFPMKEVVLLKEKFRNQPPFSLENISTVTSNKSDSREFLRGGCRQMSLTHLKSFRDH